MKKILVIWAFVIVSVLFFAAPAYAGAATLISDYSLGQNTEWTASNSPYIIENHFDIPPGTTLTIDPGTVIKFTGDGSLSVHGTLVANGASDNKIYFTDISDDSVGGVTSGGVDIDGDGQDDVDGIPSDWGIMALGGSNISIADAEIRNVSSGIYLLGNSSARQETSFSNVIMSDINSYFLSEYADISFSDVDWHAPFSDYSFLLFADTKADFDTVSIHDGEEGPLVLNSSVNFTKSIISNMSGPAFMIYNGSDVSLSSSLISNISPDNSDDAAVEVYNAGSSVDIASSTISDIDGTAFDVINATANISNSSVSNANFGVESINGTVSISDSTLANIDQYAVLTYAGMPTVLAENNFWGDATGPYNLDTNPTGLGVEVSDNVDFLNWLSSDPNQHCCSNVMFLPGIEGSRLYMPGLLIENELWEPNRDNDGKDLEFDANGNSIHQNIYTKVGDIVDKAYERLPIVNRYAPDIYKSFIDDMNTLKSNGTINDWEPIAYDWRLPYDQILDSGKVIGNEISYLSATDSPYIIQELKNLASTSKTGKVTIVAHSNGGLLTKDLMMKLQDEGLAGLVDKIIFVAVPQTGAPESIGALLHGFDQGINILSVNMLSAQEARELASNMPMTYNLLPSQTYFNDVTTPVVTYQSTSTIPFVESLLAKYGSSIDSYDTFSNFLLGTDGRDTPLYRDLTDPSIGNPILLTLASTTHDILDNWVPPSNIELIQIAGWGDDTVSGIDYYQGVKKGEATLEYKPNFVEDGDGTVPVPSALATPISSNVSRYWLDLGQYNTDAKSNASHSTIFQVAGLEDFIKNTIENGTSTLPEYFSTTSPTDVPDRELRFVLHAASTTLDAYDDAGNHTGISTTTGLIEENIPGTTYQNFGDVTIVATPIRHSGEPLRVVAGNSSDDSITLDVDQTQGGTVLSSESFVDIPMTGSSLAQVSATDSIEDIPDISSMNVDEDASDTDSFTALPVSTTTISSPIVSDIISQVSNTETVALTFHRGSSHQVSINQQNLPFVVPVSPRVTTPPISSIENKKTAQGIQQVASISSTTRNTQTASVYEAMSRSGIINFVLNVMQSTFNTVINLFGRIF